MFTADDHALPHNLTIEDSRLGPRMMLEALRSTGADLLWGYQVVELGANLPNPEPFSTIILRTPRTWRSCFRSDRGRGSGTTGMSSIAGKTSRGFLMGQDPRPSPARSIRTDVTASMPELTWDGDSRLDEEMAEDDEEWRRT